ncbi:MAG: hypothetical protein KC478_06390 [Bacteriovoracaceae bacterium]|nr:hypothetical protein [Bacteriovoracaceae bacterium]
MDFDFLPLIFLGAFAHIGLLFYYLVSGVNPYYKKNGKLTQAKIIAFKKVKQTSVSNGRKTLSTSIRPVIEFYNHGERVLFLGSNQNYLNYEIGKLVDIYYVPGIKNQVLQKENSYKVFSLISLLFVLIPLVIILFIEAPLIYKVLLPIAGSLIPLPVVSKVIKAMKANAKKLGETGKLSEIIKSKIAENSSMIDPSEFEASSEYIKDSKSFKSTVSKTNQFGIVLSSVMGFALYFLMNHVYFNRLAPSDRSLIQNFIEDFAKYRPILSELGQNENLTVFTILAGFSALIAFGFLINLKGWLKRR